MNQCWIQNNQNNTLKARLALLNNYNKDKNKVGNSNWSDSNSSFASSSESEKFGMNYDEHLEANKGEKFKPLYRQEYGGILIYDCDAIIPDQPVPKVVEPNFYDNNLLQQTNIDQNQIILPKLSIDVGSNHQRNVHLPSFNLQNSKTMPQTKAFFKEKDVKNDEYDHSESDEANYKLDTLDPSSIKHGITLHPVALNRERLNKSRISSSNNILPSLKLKSDHQNINQMYRYEPNQASTKALNKPKTNLKSLGINEVPTESRVLKRMCKNKEIITSNLTLPRTTSFETTRRKYKLILPDDLKVRFESRFENGNLKKAIKVSDDEYNLLLNYDHNTTGHTQWYYFKLISSLPAGTRIRLNILNLMKPDSLYNYGMKPWVLSHKRQKEEGMGWHRDCENISYKVTNILKKKSKEPPNDNIKSNLKLAQYYFFKLSFTYVQAYDNDVISFAHAVPYTFTYDLMPFLKRIAEDARYNEYLRIGTLWKTLAYSFSDKNECKMMIITDNIK